MEQELTFLEKLHTALFNEPGRRFGQKSGRYEGLSNPTDGVQWSFIFDKIERRVNLGINLEGMKYDDWPIARFIEREMKSPHLIEFSKDLANPENVYIRMTRDAWQVTARPQIKEKLIGDRIVSFAELTQEKWMDILQEAYECLVSEKNHRGRARQKVTLEKSGESRVMEVSPHLTIITPLWNVFPKTIESAQEIVSSKLKELGGIFGFIKSKSEA
jgi:hypothetical protein